MSCVRTADCGGPATSLSAVGCRLFTQLVASLACVQDSLNSVRELEGLIFENIRRMVLRNGAFVSIDDWKWAYQGEDLPLRMSIPGKHHQVGWIAENGAVVGLGFFTSSCKRGREGGRFTSALAGMEQVIRETAQSVQQGGGVGLDRGYTRRLSAELGACASWCNLHVTCRVSCQLAPWRLPS